ncbi:class I SAM-dependent methyltransferase [Methylococcus geothermalis]|uniref:Methyltransferase domain-containing protein n=1 Tax=Methylococcus geothermalis TaxID=2681310 RepID=A0A858Q5N2_9GAMM|nr:methyltransferase domain-containing protein [Methylococcus geothermalis]QJD29137.1 methyltransferase domain-containing protein [Methylococcus geothermalis]
MNAAAIREKWNRIYRDWNGPFPAAATVLSENAHLLPLAGGQALDLACGLGGNAVFLARRGFEVDAVDISEAGIHALGNIARKEALAIQARVADVTEIHWPAERYDVIVVSRFLERALAPAIVGALKPGGLLFYQTFVETKSSLSGPSNPRFLLRDNELVRLFGGLLIRYYRDETRTGNPNAGQRDEAFLIAQRPFS